MISNSSWRIERPRCPQGARIAIGLSLIVAAVSCGRDTPTAPSAQSSVLSFTSTAGDFIGQGQSRRFELPAAVFSGQMVDGNRRLELSIIVAGVSWSLDLAAAPLLAGRYSNATSAGSAGPLLNFSGEHRGCSIGVGEFAVLETVYGPRTGVTIISGTVTRFRARFTQHCNGPTSPPLTGDVTLVSLAPNRQ